MEQQPSQKWEYQIVTAEDGVNVTWKAGWSKGGSTIEDYIPTMGGAGWELCAIYPAGAGLKLVFKRPQGWTS